jgi:P-type E1-E2 ATPase
MTSHSNHLASRAINDSINVEPAQRVDVVEVISKGLMGTYKLHRFLLGSHAFMTENTIAITSEYSQHNNPTTACYFACDGVLLSEIILEDTIREEVYDTLENLTGVWTVLLSGDHETSVNEIAGICGFNDAAWEKSPAQKMEFVKNLIDDDRIVAMVGDGINDAPALTAANVGISVVTASDISIQVSDILLTTPRLSVIPRMRTLAQMSKQIVKQNLFWAFFYNVIGIAFAVFGVLSPIYAAAAMVISSLMVIFNAQRIKS